MTRGPSQPAAGHMAIRISFPTADQPGLELTSHPLTELYLSLLLVRNPARGPAALAPFARRARARLPKSVLRELGALSFVLGPPFPAHFLFPDGDLAGDAPLALASLSPADDALQWNIDMFAEELVSRDPAQREVADEALRDPAAIVGRLIELLRNYWSYALETEWPKLRAQLRLARAEAELDLMNGGLGSLLAHTTRRARLSDGGMTITPSIPIDLDIPLSEHDRLPVVLSLFAAPFVYTRIGDDGAAVVLPAPSAERRVTPPSFELVQGLSAIADPTRLTLLRLVAACPRSTRELAQLLELSESAISKHMRMLAAADLVRGVRHGYYVLYKLVPERAAAASDALLDFLAVPSTNGSDSRSG
jgi:DNA-binding transcriptional ArsR family regulator